MDLRGMGKISEILEHLGNNFRKRKGNEVELAPVLGEDYCAETWEPDEREAFVEGLESWLRSDENPAWRYYPNDLDQPLRAAWKSEFAPHVEFSPERLQRAKSVLSKYPTKRKRTIIRIRDQLQREHAARFSLLVRRSFKAIPEDDAYLIDLHDEGFIMEDVPWAVLRYGINGRVASRGQYEEMKKTVVEASPKSRVELELLLTDIVEMNYLRYLRYMGTKNGSKDPIEREWFLAQANAKFRLWDLTYPELVDVQPDGRIYRRVGGAIAMIQDDQRLTTIM